MATFIGTRGVQTFMAIALKAGIKLNALGIKPSRGWTVRKSLDRATSITGKPYTIRQIADAVADLEAWIDTEGANSGDLPEKGGAK